MLGIFTGKGSCHGNAAEHDRPGMKKILLVGAPNVGKSVLFNCLTGTYVTVSNYPGTTIEISSGRYKIDGEYWKIIDSPGMYSLLPLTEEEAVTRRLLVEEYPEEVIHVLDAKNIHRTLSLTLQLIEANLPVVLVVNMMDEAAKLGIEIDFSGLERCLGIPVLGTTLTKNRGVQELQQVVKERARHIS